MQPFKKAIHILDYMAVASDSSQKFEFISAQDQFNCRWTASSFAEVQFPLDRVKFGLSNNPKSFSPFVSRESA